MTSAWKVLMFYLSESVKNIEEERMDELNTLRIIGVFVAMAVTDLIWVFYIRRVNQGKAFQAALTSPLLLLLGAFIVINYMENKWYLLPTLLGAFVGTFLATKFDSEKRKLPFSNHKKAP